SHATAHRERIVQVSAWLSVSADYSVSDGPTHAGKRSHPGCLHRRSYSSDEEANVNRGRSSVRPWDWSAGCRLHRYFGLIDPMIPVCFHALEEITMPSLDRRAVVFDTLRTSREGAVLFADIAAPPMNLLGPELVRDLVSLIRLAEADASVQVL